MDIAPRGTILRGMKFIWTIIFLAIAGAIFGITYLLVPASSHTDKFWLSMGGIGAGLFLLYVAFAFAPSPGGEQSGSLMRGQFATASLLYCIAMFLLALVAIAPMSFTWLAVLHILALLLWVLIVGVGALGAAALRRADQGNTGKGK